MASLGAFQRQSSPKERVACWYYMMRSICTGLVIVWVYRILSEILTLSVFTQKTEPENKYQIGISDSLHNTKNSTTTIRYIVPYMFMKVPQLCSCNTPLFLKQPPYVRQPSCFLQESLRWFWNPRYQELVDCFRSILRKSRQWFPCRIISFYLTKPL